MMTQFIRKTNKMEQSYFSNKDREKVFIYVHMKRKYEINETYKKNKSA